MAAANFLGLGPAGFRHVDIQKHGGDSFIDFGFPKLGEETTQRLWLAAKDAPEWIIRNVVRHRAGDF
jgi:hypothetical protein